MLIAFVCFSKLIKVLNTFHENIKGERQRKSEKLFLCNVVFAVMDRGVWRGDLFCILSYWVSVHKFVHLALKFYPDSYCSQCCLS